MEQEFKRGDRVQCREFLDDPWHEAIFFDMNDMADAQPYLVHVFVDDDRIALGIDSFKYCRHARPDLKMNWIPTTERLPETNKYVLAYYVNFLRKGRRIRAFYAPRFTVESYDEDDESYEYDEKTDCYYLPEGWYECNEHEDVHWRVNEPVTHWMPLPDPPGKDK